VALSYPLTSLPGQTFPAPVCFLAVLGVVATWGLRPGLLAIVVASALTNFYIPSQHGAWSWQAGPPAA
jgi:hypothetical protein